jgi:RimJ/RimL family protein N-acetyltransferase
MAASATRWYSPDWQESDLMNNPYLLMDFPDFLQTERLLLRPPRSGDGAEIYEAIIESREHLMPWLEWAHADETEADLEAHIRRLAGHFALRTDFEWMLYEQASQEFLGAVALHPAEQPGEPFFRMECWVRTFGQGQGYMTEAVTAVADFALTTMKVQRIEARIDSRNARAVALAVHCGFALEGRLRQHSRDVWGNLVDILVYARIAE